MDRQPASAFHVVDAGTEVTVAIAPQRQPALQGAREMHGVEVRENEDAGVCSRLCPQSRQQNVGIAAGARHPFDAGTQRLHVGCGEIHHPVDAGRVRRGAFDLHPRQDAGENFFGIEMVCR
jgi:hypothetical protein